MVEVKVPLAKMKMKQLSDELAARGAPKSGTRKRVLQLRLRALIIRAAAAARAAPAWLMERPVALVRISPVRNGSKNFTGTKTACVYTQFHHFVKSGEISPTTRLGTVLPVSLHRLLRLLRRRACQLATPRHPVTAFSCV